MMQLFLLILLSQLLVQDANSTTQLHSDFTCPMYIFTPLDLGPGLDYLTAALLAVEQFNTRDTVAVPELKRYLECPITVPFPTAATTMADVNFGAAASTIETSDATRTSTTILSQTSKVFDTGYGDSSSQVTRSFASQLPEVPCTAIGPFHNVPAVALANVANTFAFPLVIAKAQDVYSIYDAIVPTAVQTYPTVLQTAIALQQTLLHLNRTDYVAVIYPVSPFGTQIREVLTVALNEANVTHLHFGVSPELLDPLVILEYPEAEDELNGILTQVKKSGYRTIVLALEAPSLQLPVMARYAIRNGLTSNGDYLWVHFGEFDFGFLFNNTDSEVSHFLKGSILSQPRDEEGEDNFVAGWQSINEDFASRLRASYPADAPGGSILANVTAYDLVATGPTYLTGFAYDAAMTAAMGICEAWMSLQDPNAQHIPIDSHLAGIERVDFFGATGHVHYFEGIRSDNSLEYVVLNLLPPGPPNTTFVEFTATAIILADGSVIALEDNIFADGRNVPPSLLRDLPKQNYLSDEIRMVGRLLVVFALLMAALAAVWTFLQRNHKVLRAAQPEFLYLLCLGSAILACASIPLSFDESNGHSISSLNHACASVPWLFTCGYIVIYSALFMKLWRVNKVLQFARRRVDVKQVVWPFALVMLAGVVVLTSWTVIDPLEWDRVELDEDTGESIGRCGSPNMEAYVFSLVAVIMMPTVLTLWMSWKTRDVNDAYSEAYWIMFMVIIQLEVIVISLPMVAILRERNSNARYLGISVLFWIVPISTLALIFGPKVWSVYKKDETQRTTRGPMGGNVHITGITIATPVSGGDGPPQRSSTSSFDDANGSKAAHSKASEPGKD